MDILLKCESTKDSFVFKIVGIGNNLHKAIYIFI